MTGNGNLEKGPDSGGFEHTQDTGEELGRLEDDVEGADRLDELQMDVDASTDRRNRDAAADAMILRNSPYEPDAQRYGEAELALESFLGPEDSEQRERILRYFSAAAEHYDIPFEYLLGLSWLESHLNAGEGNPVDFRTGETRSTARGLTQFTPGTWAMFQKACPKWLVGREPDDLEASIWAAAWYARYNARKVGIEVHSDPSKGESDPDALQLLYRCHHEGDGDFDEFDDMEGDMSPARKNYRGNLFLRYGLVGDGIETKDDYHHVIESCGREVQRISERYAEILGKKRASGLMEDASSSLWERAQNAVMSFGAGLAAAPGRLWSYVSKFASDIMFFFGFSGGKEKLEEVEEHESLVFPEECYVSSDIQTDRVHPVTENIQDHKGVDIPMPVGTPLVWNMPGPGKIIHKDPNDFGSMYSVNILYKGEVFRYLHLSGPMLIDGQSDGYKGMPGLGATVNPGDTFAHSGGTGVGTGPHLHYERRVYDGKGSFGEALDPYPYLPKHIQSQLLAERKAHTDEHGQDDYWLHA